MSNEQLERLTRIIGELEARLARLDRESGAIREDLALLRDGVQRALFAETVTILARAPLADAEVAPVVAPSPVASPATTRATAAAATTPATADAARTSETAAAATTSATTHATADAATTHATAAAATTSATAAAATTNATADAATTPATHAPHLAASAAAAQAQDVTTSAAAASAKRAQNAAETLSSPARPPVADADEAHAAHDGFEQQVALVWFARLGALVLLCGVGYLYSYAVERHWISPLARCLLGAGVGVALIGGAELLRRTTHALYVQVLLGLGVSFLYLSDYAAYSFYGLLTAPMALRLAAVISFVGGFLATRHRSQAIFIFSLLGGFLAPIILSTGEDQPAALFAYLLAISATSLVVSLRQRFLYAAWTAVAGTQLLFFGWYFHFFSASGGLSVARDYATLEARTTALIAVALFTLEALVVHRRTRGLFAPPTPLAFLLVALLFGHAGLFALLFDQPLVAIAALLVLAFVAALLLRDEPPELMTVPLVAGWIAIAQLPASDGLSVPLIGMLAWAAVYFATSARALVAGAEALAASRLLPVSLAGIAAVELSLAHSGDDVMLRALLVAAVAIADGALAFTLRRRQAGRAVNLLVGQSFALVAMAMDFAFLASLVTLMWSILATTQLVLAAREEETDWLGFSLALWTVTLMRAVARAFAADVIIELELVVCAIGLIASWTVVRRHALPAFRRWSGWLLTAGHLLLLASLLVRLASAAPELPDTLVIAVYATLLVAGGFVFRERQNRYLGLTLFSVTIAKLLLWDIFHRDVLFRVLVLIGVGVLLLGASFLYARYGRRLITLVRDGELPGTK